MGQMACLAIGISDAPPLDYLPGAVNGAKALAAWAKKAGYQTKLLIDDKKPVGITNVKSALNKLLPKGAKTDRLIIYFAGHGLARDAAEDLWLLSEWHQNQEAVAVGGLKRKLERFGVDQITIISDACRSLPGDTDSADLTSHNVLGRGPFLSNLPSLDMLKASSKFKAAYMIPGQTSADDRCIFTGVVEEALWGHQAAAFHPTRQCVTSGSLANFLKEAVPSRAEFYKVELRPEISPGFIDPNDVYLTKAPTGAPPLKAWPPPGPPGSMGAGGGGPPGGNRGWSTAGSTGFEKAAASPDVDALPEDEGTFINLPGMMSGFMPDGGMAPLSRSRRTASIGPTSPSRPRDLPRPEPRRPEPPRHEPPPRETPRQERARIERERKKRHDRADKYLAAYQREDRPDHFETRSGFSVTGAKVAGALAGSEVIVETHGGPNRWRVRDPVAMVLQRPLPLLIELKDGRWLGSAAIPEFIQTFTVDKTGAVSVIYRLIDGPPAGKTENAVSKLRAGMFKAAEAYDHALGFRGGKHRDPMLGVLAAYLYDSQGDVESVRQIAYFFAAARQPIPFDVVMLGRMQSELRDGKTIALVPAVKKREPRTEREAQQRWVYEATAATKGEVAGAFPWLRQGWQFVDDGDAPLMAPGLEKVRPHLLPAPFTTLTPEGGKLLRKIIFGGRK